MIMNETNQLSFSFDKTAYPFSGNEPEADLFLEINVTIIYSPGEFRELIPNVKALFTKEGHLQLNSVIQTLRNEGFPVNKGLLFYYSKVADLFVYSGKLPFGSDILIPAYEFYDQSPNKQLYLKIRESEAPPQEFIEIPETIPDTLKHEETFGSSESSIEGFDQEETSEDHVTKKKSRHKERTIHEALKLVAEWRKIHKEGYTEQDSSEIIYPTLEEAAKRVGVVKKSLDDYFLMIKHAKLHGFDFEKNSNERFGVLRAFVKKNKQKKESQKTNDILNEILEVTSNNPVQINPKSKKIQKTNISK